MEDLQIIKLGGKIVSDQRKLNTALNTFSKIQSKKILIHGGGNLATALSRKLNIEPKMIEGRRITDDEMIDIVTMVYGGKLSKEIVAKCQAKHINAIGISGADGNIILSKKRPVKEIDFGHVGDIEKVNTGSLISLMSVGFTPVICALTHDGKGNLLNTNADTIAAEVSSALSAFFDVSLLYGFEFPGVMEDVLDINTVMPKINYEDFQKMKIENKINAGMIPKLDNAFNALNTNVSEVFICGFDRLNEPKKGTQIC